METNVEDARREMGRLAARIATAQSRLDSNTSLDAVFAEVTSVQHDVESFLFRSRQFMSAEAVRTLIWCIRSLQLSLDQVVAGREASEPRHGRRH